MLKISYHKEKMTGVQTCALPILKVEITITPKTTQKIRQYFLYLLLLLLKLKKVSSIIVGILFTPLKLPILFSKTFCSPFFPVFPLLLLF